MKSLVDYINENLLTEGVTTYLVTDNIDGKT